jgi:hypothetical protein
MTAFGIRAASRALAAVALLAGIGTPAMAGKLRCSFTEPFFDIEFDSATGRVVYTSPHEVEEGTDKPKPRVLAEGARIRRSGAWETFDVLFLETPGKDAATPPNIIIEIKVTGQGSDGMSKSVFPFEGRHGGWVGGCETGKAPAYDSNEVFHDLGVIEDQQ